MIRIASRTRVLNAQGKNFAGSSCEIKVTRDSASNPLVLKVAWTDGTLQNRFSDTWSLSNFEEIRQQLSGISPPPDKIPFKECLEDFLNEMP
jgi:hypothetical protein